MIPRVVCNSADGLGLCSVATVDLSNTQFSSNAVLSLGSVEVVAMTHATQPPEQYLASCAGMLSYRAESGLRCSSRWPSGD